MKKTLKTFLLSFALLAFSFMVFCTPANAMSKSKQHKLYKSTIKKYSSSIRKNAVTGGSPYSLKGYKVLYGYADIDKNGVDELILRFGIPKEVKNTAISSGYGETTAIYTIRGKKVKTVVGRKQWAPFIHDDYVHVYKGSQYINKAFSSSGAPDDFYLFSKGKLAKKPKYSLSSYYDEYMINDKKVSKSTFVSRYNKLTNKQKGYTLKVYK